MLGHTGAVNQLDWRGAGGGVLVSASDDGTVKVWGEQQQEGRADSE